jgi:hypothetical protein
MKSIFLKKHFLLFTLSLFFSNILVGCSINTSATDPYNKKDSSISQVEKKEISADSSKEVNTDEKDKNSIPTQTNKISSKVKLYEGTYFDDRRFGDNILKNFCEVIISNVTDTSFDFAIYQANTETGEKKVIFLKNTAVFIGDGTKAAFYGKEYTLNFTFPNNHNALPIATDMKISGFEPLEGKTYVNNGIPGHEFG